LIFSTGVPDIQHGRAVPERTVQTPTLDGPNYHFGRAKLTLWTGLGLTYLTSKTLLQVKLVKFWPPNFLPTSRLFIILPPNMKLMPKTTWC